MYPYSGERPSKPGKLSASVSAIFIAIGMKPDNQLFAGKIPLDESGYLAVGGGLHHPIPGVYVAGDSRTKFCARLLQPADGAVAAVQAENYMNWKNRE